MGKREQNKRLRNLGGSHSDHRFPGQRPCVFKTGSDTQFLCVSNGQFTYLIYLLTYLEEQEEGGGDREFVVLPISAFIG